MRKALQFFGILDDLDVQWMAQTGVKQFVRSGTTLIREQSDLAAIYFLLEGRLAIVSPGEGGAEIAALLPGEIVGEFSFIDARPSATSVIAVQDSVVLTVSRESVSTKLRGDAGFSSRFYRAIACFLADRLYVTVGRLGYGNMQLSVDVDEVPEDDMDRISMGAERFDRLLKDVSGSYSARAIGTKERLSRNIDLRETSM
jgi:CRP/FNR family cyclic AMP-dependent transcriptional regulator